MTREIVPTSNTYYYVEANTPTKSWVVTGYKHKNHAELHVDYARDFAREHIVEGEETLPQIPYNPWDKRLSYRYDIPGERLWYEIRQVEIWEAINHPDRYQLSEHLNSVKKYLDRVYNTAATSIPMPSFTFKSNICQKMFDPINIIMDKLDRESNETLCESIKENVISICKAEIEYVISVLNKQAGED